MLVFEKGEDRWVRKTSQSFIIFKQKGKTKRSRSMKRKSLKRGSDGQLQKSVSSMIKKQRKQTTLERVVRTLTDESTTNLNFQEGQEK